MSTHYAISRRELGRLKLAIVLSFVFIFFPLVLHLGPLSFSISAIIVTGLLVSILPTKMETDKDGRQYVSQQKEQFDNFTDKNGNAEKHPLYPTFLDEDNSRNFLTLENRKLEFVTWLNARNNPKNTPPSNSD